MIRLILYALWCGLAVVPSRDAGAQSTGILRVWTGDIWREWWSAADPPALWKGTHAVFAKAVKWKPLQPGIEWAEVRVSGSGEAIRLRLVLVRLDPAYVRIALAYPALGTRTPDTWTVNSASRSVAVALNAGQFTDTGPWGWIVTGGVEVQAPGTGALSVGIAVDASGKVNWIEPDSIPAARSRGIVREAFQSFPVLLAGDGVIPEPLRREGLGVDLRHRDSRLALGELRDGRLLIVLTRLDLVPQPLDATPFGFTVPEMAAVMGGLGCRRAVMLDGGISGQLILRDKTGRTRAWRGWRTVPLGLVVTGKPIAIAPMISGLR